MPTNFPFSIGWIIALIVLIVCIILAIIGDPLTRNRILALIGALAVARLVP